MFGAAWPEKVQALARDFVQDSQAQADTLIPKPKPEITWLLRFLFVG